MAPSAGMIATLQVTILKNQTELNNKLMLKKGNSHRMSDYESACGSVSAMLTVQQ